MRLAWVAIVATGLTLASCGHDPVADAAQKLDKAEAASWRCNRDVERVPFEHSGNCIAIVRWLMDNADLYNKCKAFKCRSIRERAVFLDRQLWLAATKSVIRFGQPRLPGMAPGPDASAAFHMTERLEAALAQCVIDHPAETRSIIRSGRAVLRAPLSDYCREEGFEEKRSLPL